MLVALLFAWPSRADADTSTCSYFPFPIRFVALNVTDTGPFDQQGIAVNGSKIQRNSDGVLVDCGAATTSNTDLVIISDVTPGASGSVDPVISMSTAPFAPGFVNEPGSSEEIEFFVDLGGGPDTLYIDSFGPATMSMGRSDEDRLVNLNAFEIDGIDSDMTLEGVDQIWASAASPADIRANGRKGTGGMPLDLRLTLFGGDGRNRLAGGSRADRLFGSARTDRLSGGGGKDDLNGLAGADVLRGQGGRDRLYGGKGRDVLKGGKRRDRCWDIRRGTTFLSCERRTFSLF